MGQTQTKLNEYDYIKDIFKNVPWRGLKLKTDIITNDLKSLTEMKEDLIDYIITNTYPLRWNNVKYKAIMEIDKYINIILVNSNKIKDVPDIGYILIDEYNYVYYWDVTQQHYDNHSVTPIYKSHAEREDCCNRWGYGAHDCRIKTIEIAGGKIQIKKPAKLDDIKEIFGSNYNDNKIDRVISHYYTTPTFYVQRMEKWHSNYLKYSDDKYVKYNIQKITKDEKDKLLRFLRYYFKMLKLVNNEIIKKILKPILTEVMLKDLSEIVMSYV